MKPLGPFTRTATNISKRAGHPAAFVSAIVILVVWLLTGPVFGFSTTWQLVINTGTSITTFLMVFLIQNTQNRNIEALQLKLDELIRAQYGAHNALLDIEGLSEEDLDRLRARYERIAMTARKKTDDGKPDTDTPPVNPL